MIASWMPPPAMVQATASVRTDRTLCRAASRASSTTRSIWRCSARLALMVRSARSPPSSTPPSRPSDSWACSWALAMRGMSDPTSTPMTTIARSVVPSRTVSSTAMRTIVPTSPTTALTRLTMLDDAASRSSTVSEVTRVTSSPVGRDPSAPTLARKKRRTIEVRASSTTRSASVPSRIHCHRPRTSPTSRSPTSSPTAGASEAPVPSVSRTRLVTMGVARLAAVVPSPRTRPSASVRRWGLTKVHRTLRRGRSGPLGSGGPEFSRVGSVDAGAVAAMRPVEHACPISDKRRPVASRIR